MNTFLLHENLRHRERRSVSRKQPRERERESGGDLGGSRQEKTPSARMIWRVFISGTVMRSLWR
jgi:hypothetical protein